MCIPSPAHATAAFAVSAWYADARCLLLRRLVLGRRRRLAEEDDDPPAYRPRRVPKALSAMPALIELELVGPSFLSAAPERELAAAPQPAFARLTSLSMSYERDSRSEATALYLWLRWAMPAAPQLRKLSVSGLETGSDQGLFPSAAVVRSPVSTRALLNAGDVLGCRAHVLLCPLSLSSLHVHDHAPRLISCAPCLQGWTPIATRS